MEQCFLSTGGGSDGERENPASPCPNISRRSPVVRAVLRARRATEYRLVIGAVIAGGVTHIELTLSTAGVFDELPALLDRIWQGRLDRSRHDHDHRTGGAGDRRRGAATSSARRWCSRSSHAADRRGPRRCSRAGLSPDRTLARDGGSGATAVKLFPASLAGPGYLKDLRGPFPGIQVLPSGGITPESALDWLRAGACAVSIRRAASAGRIPARRMGHAAQACAGTYDTHLRRNRYRGCGIMNASVAGGRVLTLGESMGLLRQETPGPLRTQHTLGFGFGRGRIKCGHRAEPLGRAFDVARPPRSRQRWRPD